MFSTAVVLVWRVSEHPEVRPVEIVEAGHGGRVQGREVAGRQLIRAAAAARVPGRGCNIQRQGHAFMDGILNLQEPHLCCRTWPPSCGRCTSDLLTMSQL